MEDSECPYFGRLIVAGVHEVALISGTTQDITIFTKLDANTRAIRQRIDEQHL